MPDPTRFVVARLAILAIAAMLPMGCSETDAPSAPAVAGDPGSVPATAPPEVLDLVTLVNQHRVAMGLAPLVWHEGVAAVATAHSEDMEDRGFFSHTNPDGATPWDRLAAAGITYTAAGENIAYGYPTGSAVLTAWLGSSGHRANIENATFTHHGVGLSGTYWTHVFIRPSGGAAAAIP